MKRKQILLTVACVCVLLGVNFYVVRDLFTLEWSRHMGSAEGAFIGIARYALQNWPHLDWFPLWYGGIPYQNTYPPLLHLVVAAVAALTRISPAQAHHAAIAAVYCLGPVTLFWMAFRLSGHRGRSLVAGLIYSLASPTHLLVRDLRADTGGILNPRRFYSMVFYGDTPHLMALMLVPVAIVLLDRALEKRTPASYLLAALGLAAVPLTNWIGAFALALAVAAYLASRDFSRRESVTTVLLAVAAYFIASPWIPPSTLNAIRTNSSWMSPDNHLEWINVAYWAPLAAAIGLLFFLLRRWRVASCWRFALLFTLSVSWITLGSYWFHLLLIAQPIRYHIELDLGLSLLAALGLAELFARLPKPACWVLAIGLILFGCLEVKTCRRFARHWSQPGDVRSTMEYKSAAWLDRNMQGRRVMASGSGHVFLNAWSDVPQLSGGFDQGVTNIVVPSAIHWFYKAWNEIDRNGATTILLMRALGVHAICVGGPNSKDFFKPQVHPERFAACGLPVLWREGDDVIYGIPARSTSLAHVMARGDLVRHRLNIPVHLEEVERYVSALEKPSYPLAEIEWHRPARGTVKADLTQGQVLSLQICHHPGWHATVNGEPRRVFSDGLGLMAVEPGCQGRCTVELVYDGGWEATIARWFSRITLALALLWCAARAMSRFANVRA